MEEKLFKNLSDKIQKKIDDKKYSTLARIPTNNSDLQDYEQSNSLDLIIDVNTNNDVNFQVCSYNYRFWNVPQDFEIPSNVK